MNASSTSLHRSGWSRRLIVTLAIGTAAAAVAANVAFGEGDAASIEVRSATAILLLPHPAPGPDPSLPSAEKALAHGADSSEAAPSF